MAKLMLELQQNETAAELLESLLEENDDVSEVWFLLATALSHFDVPAAIEPLNQCKAVRIYYYYHLEDPAKLGS